jgi:hypothetical protein
MIDKTKEIWNTHGVSKTVDATGGIPIWRTQHAFVSFRNAEPRPVATYGLIAVGLSAVATAENVRRHGDAIGYEWLAVTADRLRGTGRCELSDFLRIELGVGMPTRGAGLQRPSALATEGDVPDAVIERFAADEAPRIRQWARNAYGGLDSKLLQLARDRERVPAGNYLGVAERTLRRLDPPLAFQPVIVQDGAGHRFYTFAYGDLVERAALELFFLVTEAPRIGVCRRCGRAFVPVAGRRGGMRCPNNVWDTITREPVALCQPTPPTPSERDTRERERKRIHQNWRRAVRRYGKGHPTASRAEQEWLEWKAKNPAARRPGRPESPQTLDELEFISERTTRNEQEK